MASSPTPSSSSSSAASPSSFSDLPAVAMRNKIVEKILENRVTLIVGETGCGKSSQIPQFLLEENMEPILCTQPRRFAVVAVARMVAKARNCEIGGEVGYHIGHSRVFSASSKIVFKTAGVLLDEMREKGLKALRYKVIVLDEVHERSVESDLVLVCIKQFLLRSKDLRVVLMSATADISRYREYFKDLGRGERVELLAIPNTGMNTIFQRKVLYLEQISELLGMESENLSLKYCSAPSPKMALADLKPEVHKLIHDLVLHIHKNEPDIEKSILIFLPTYYALEQQWFLLKPFGESFKVHVLHSSIDTDQALRAMRIWKSHRKVILATNIAESSVTIPKVGYVIDSCRSLQVFWDDCSKTDTAELVWVSKSQAEQRRGRTGRTCDGVVYRMVTGSFYGQLDDYESPAILKLSLRLQVLLICCAESRAINEPKALLQKAMDPPEPYVIEDALDLLVHMRALEKASSRGRNEPTYYGRLLASFSLSFDASVLVLKFADIGLVREGIIFGVLMDQQPLPILRPFGLDNQVMEYTDNYYSGNSKNTGLGRKEASYMGNFCAFQFWQRVLKDKFRVEQLISIFKPDEAVDTELLVPKIEEKWCSFHNLVLTALEQVTDTYHDILNLVHRFRPKFLAMSNSIPIHYDPYDFQHSCNLQFIENKEANALAVEGEELEHDNVSRKCIAAPFVGPYDFHADEVARKFASIVKEMRIQLTEDGSREQNTFTYNNGQYTTDGGAALCRYFVSGSCNRGSQCTFSHSLQAKRPPCKFFFSLQGCRSGDSCFFSHDCDSLAIPVSQSSLCLPEDENINEESLLQFFPSPSDGCVLLLDDIKLHFSSHLVHQYEPSSIISTTSETDSVSIDPSLVSIKVLWGLSHPYQTIISTEGHNLVPWSEVKCVLWFPRFDQDYGEAHQKNLVQTFFSYLAIRILADTLHEVRVILTVNNMRFSNLEVEKLARDSFFFLKASVPFDESSFGKVHDEVTSKKSMLVSKPISYIFELHPPRDFQYGDYRALLRQQLHDPSFSPLSTLTLHSLAFSNPSFANLAICPLVGRKRTLVGKFDRRWNEHPKHDGHLHLLLKWSLHRLSPTVIVYARPEIVEQMRAMLHAIGGNDVVQLFRSGCFGHFLDYKGGDVQKKVIHSLMSHEVCVSDRALVGREAWFQIHRSRLHFGPSEYNLVSGLRFGASTFDLNDAHVVPPRASYYQLFEGKRMTLHEIELRFTQMRMARDAPDYVKVEFLSIGRIFLPNADALHQPPTYDSSGYGRERPRDIWACEVIPELALEIGMHSEQLTMPRCLRWTFSRPTTDISTLLQGSLRVVSLVPSPDETTTPYYQSMQLEGGAQSVRFVSPEKGNKKKMLANAASCCSTSAADIVGPSTRGTRAIRRLQKGPQASRALRDKLDDEIPAMREDMMPYIQEVVDQAVERAITSLSREQGSAPSHHSAGPSYRSPMPNMGHYNPKPSEHSAVRAPTLPAQSALQLILQQEDTGISASHPTRRDTGYSSTIQLMNVQDDAIFIVAYG
ncbi:zinc finger helicase family protein [Perilla frutescens var. hirtella]|uniref:RNA helicase n=1 Tax=Perilla frutescens var. hirtella TaxID=608512 RepID=A0AAD4P2Q1_PERFH|nr:zinc finger helicase family protein [Perilla frutescens var. hirtella]